jgi:hypothetical protein
MATAYQIDISPPLTTLSKVASSDRSMVKHRHCQKGRKITI